MRKLWSRAHTRMTIKLHLFFLWTIPITNYAWWLDLVDIIPYWTWSSMMNPWSICHYLLSWVLPSGWWSVCSKTIGFQSFKQSFRNDLQCGTWWKHFWKKNLSIMKVLVTFCKPTMVVVSSGAGPVEAVYNVANDTIQCPYGYSPHLFCL